MLHPISIFNPIGQGVNNVAFRFRSHGSQFHRRVYFFDPVHPTRSGSLLELMSSQHVSLTGPLDNIRQKSTAHIALGNARLSSIHDGYNRYSAINDVFQEWNTNRHVTHTHIHLDDCPAGKRHSFSLCDTEASTHTFLSNL